MCWFACSCGVCSGRFLRCRVGSVHLKCWLPLAAWLHVKQPAASITVSSKWRYKALWEVLAGVYPPQRLVLYSFVLSLGAPVCPVEAWKTRMH